MADPTTALAVTVRLCTVCGRMHPGEPESCEQCGAPNLESRELAGRGRLVTWTVVRRPPDAFAGEGPMTIGLVDIDGGPRMTARLPVLEDEPELGCRVRVSGWRNGVPWCELD